MTEERAKELILRKLRRVTEIKISDLTNSFHGRIHEIRKLIEELIVEGKVTGRKKENRYGPDSFIIRYGGENLDDNPYSDIINSQSKLHR